MAHSVSGGRFQAWVAAGFPSAHLVSLTIPGCVLAEQSEIEPADCGKSPGRRNRLGTWGGYGWQAHEATPADLDAWEAAGANIGLKTEWWPALDCDVDDAELAGAIAKLAAEVLGAAPVRTRGNARWLRLYRWAWPAPKLALVWQRGGVKEKVELLGRGQQTAVQGLHPSLARYLWDRRPRAEDLTEIDDAALARFFDQLGALVELYGGEALVHEAGAAGDRREIRARPGGVPAALRAEMAAVAEAIPCEELDYHAWVKHLAAWKAWSGGDEAIYSEIVERWSAGYGDNTPEATRKRWDSFSAVSLSGDFLVSSARAGGYAGPGTALVDFPPLSAADLAAAFGAAEEVRVSAREEAALAGLTDAALALDFAALHADSLRYVAVWGKWLRWDGRRWAIDEKRGVTNLVLEFCRGAALGKKKTVRAALESAKTISAVEKLAACDPRLARGADSWDADPWLLNTPAAVVDLRTGRFLAHDPALQMTKITAASPALRADAAPIFSLFLSRVCGGDGDLVSFLQRVVGYCLTGSTREHALFFLWGSGSNGKSVFLSTVAGLLGDYAVSAPMETFTASAHDRHPTELARLRGARLVTASETENGRRWAEAKIKALTGGDKIAAHFMRQDFFEFVPEFKLVIAGNHKPGLRGVDEAIGRRMNLVPFTVTIPAGERDETLGDKLRAEWGGILAWAIAGCLAWQGVAAGSGASSGAGGGAGGGLAAPSAVRDATAEYLATEDALGQWLSERCVLTKAGETSSAALYQDWTQWANPAGEHVGSRKAFTQAVLSRSGAITMRRVENGMVFRGVKLRPPGDFTEAGVVADSNILQFPPKT